MARLYPDGALRPPGFPPCPLACLTLGETSCGHNGHVRRQCRQSGISVDALGTRPSTPCPDCGAVSRRVHSRYRPTLADCPVGGRPWVVRPTVRRFFQDVPPLCGL
ncbi:transposase family protein [Streptomyces mirabilis]|uniref:transposase family protein n=1 Tax=Streptomyces mirabilis TaxID=68239 RepID=UPI0036B0FE2D